MNDILKFSIAGNGFNTACAPRLALGIGVFDGVHLGHRRIISELVRQAKRNGAVPAAMTFDPHPRAVLHPTEAPTLLVPLSERIRLLREAGAELVLVVRFTAEFAQLERRSFCAGCWSARNSVWPESASENGGGSAAAAAATPRCCVNTPGAADSISLPAPNWRSAAKPSAPASSAGRSRQGGSTRPPKCSAAPTG